MSLVAQKLISASGPKEVTDADFNLVTSLYHFDGSNGAQNKTFLDSSDSGHTLTRYGSTTQGTFSPFSSEEGKWSVIFDGTDDYLSLPNHSDFTFGSDNWTVEAFVNVNAIDTNYKCIYSASYGVQFYVYNNQLHLAINDTDNTGGYMISANSTAGQIASVGVWYHVAAYRDGNNFYCSVDGTVSSMGTSSATIATPSAYAPSIGIWGGTSLPMNGYISNLRVIKGTALYGSSNFTAPSTPLTAVTNTKLLTCCSNRFRDKSTTAHAVTPSSEPKIQPFSPFSPSAEYDSAVNGGSGYFDGSGDYLGLPSSNDFDFSGSFTIEAWVYLEDLSTSRTILGTCANIGGRGGIYFGTSGNNLIFFQYITNTTLITSSSSIIKHQWNHVAAVRHGVSIYLYINGTSVGNTTFSNSFSGDSANGGVGGFYSNPGIYYLDGYMADMRVVNGTAMYTSNFTPPTAPLTKVTNTKLLANFTNSAAFDQTGKTNAITRANAQLDTSVKKFGTASLELDGTGDYLHIPSNFPLIGTRDYTIELFAYFTGNSSTSGGLFAAGNPSSAVTVPAMALRDTTGLTIYTGAGQKITGDTGLLSLNTWYHLAMVRASGVIKVFKDGSLVSWDDGSSTVSDTSNITSTEFVIGKYYSDSYLLNGYIDEFRISLKARYTSNFTAPTKEFPNL